MTEKLRQSLSAAVDDEADAFELRRVMDELGRDPELKRLWEHYHLIGTVLRGESVRVPEDLRERVWAALETDPELPTEPAEVAPEAPAAVTVAPPERSRAGRYTGLAVAASVAFAVVLGFSGLGGGDDTSAPGIAATNESAAPAAASATLAEAAAPPGDSGPEISPSDVQRAHAYMLHHAQQQALNQAGVMSFVKLATYEAP